MADLTQFTMSKVLNVAFILLTYKLRIQYFNFLIYVCFLIILNVVKFYYLKIFVSWWMHFAPFRALNLDLCYNCFVKYCGSHTKDLVYFVLIVKTLNIISHNVGLHHKNIITSQVTIIFIIVTIIAELCEL